MNDEQVSVLKRTIAKGCSDDEFALFLEVCKRTQLDPFAKQICPVSRWDKKENRNVMHIQVQIDGFRVLAQRTGQYGGSDRPLFDEGLTLYEHLQTKRGKPQTCSITVYRLVCGNRCPFTAEITWDEFYPGQKQGFMWDSKPYQMLSKAAESQALRKTFQLELVHLETPENAVPIVISTQAQTRSSSEWIELRRKILNCSKLEDIEGLVQEVRRRTFVGEHEIDRLATTAKNLIEMRSTAPPSVASLTKASLTKEQQRITFFIKKTNTELEQIQEIVTRLQLPKASAEMDQDQAFLLIGEMLIEWAIRSNWLDRSIVSNLLKKSIDRTKTDKELWEDFCLSIESYEMENKAS